MTAAILNIVGGLGMAGFLALMLLRGAWVRQGMNRAVGAAIMLASVGCVTQAMALEQYGSRAQTMQLVAYAAFGGALAAAVIWFLRKR
jgi:hypothetical protein